jgi:hypothetical protein
MVLRRSACFVAVLSVVATPAVTSTRFFCRYTGVEITGCAEAATHSHATFRADGCCDQRTFRALEGVKLVDEQQQQVPTPISISTAPALLAYALTPLVAEVRRPSAPSAGPPAFITHRALLI